MEGRNKQREEIEIEKRGKKPRFFKERFAVFRRLIRRWKQLVEHNGGTFHVVLLPDHNPAASPRVPAILQEEDIETISLYDCFGAYDAEHYRTPWSDSPYRFKSDMHWNEAGNRLAALCLYRVLEEDMRLPTLAEETLRATLHRYYAAFEEWMPMEPELFAADAGIREKYQALQNQYEALQDRRIPIERIDRCVSTKLIIRSTFSVCLSGKSLIYHKEGCRLADLSAHSSCTSPRFTEPTCLDTDFPTGSTMWLFVRRASRSAGIPAH